MSLHSVQVSVKTTRFLRVSNEVRRNQTGLIFKAITLCGKSQTLNMKAAGWLTPAVVKHTHACPHHPAAVHSHLCLFSFYDHHRGPAVSITVLDASLFIRPPSSSSLLSSPVCSSPLSQQHQFAHCSCYTRPLHPAPSRLPIKHNTQANQINHRSPPSPAPASTCLPCQHCMCICRKPSML